MLMKFITAVTVALVLVLAGCATPRVQSVAGTTTNALRTTCTHQLQEGCIEMRALNYGPNPGVKLVERYAKSPVTDSERQWRVQYASPELWQAYLREEVRSTGSRTFRYFVFKANDVPKGDVQAYRVNGKNVVTKVEARDVTGMVSYPQTNLGAPTKVYEVDAIGSESVGASIQFPWAMFAPGTTILICATDNDGIYPSGTVVNGAHEGLWFTPESLNWFREKGSKRVLSSFISKR